MPFSIIRFKEDKDHFNAALYREFLENGLKFRDKRVAITSERVFSSGNYWFRRLGILRKICISVFDDPKDIISFLRKNKPEVISGYPSALKLLALVMAEKGIEEINPRLIFTHAELLDNDTRKTINSVFGVKLSDLYGCMEVGPISWQCPEHEDYHMNIDHAVVEFIKDGERSTYGEKGEIVLTGLYSFAMPFIRYKVGDIGISTDEKCPCGRGLPMMKGIEGRLVDSIILPNGRVISPYAFTCAIENVPGIKRFQVVQEKRNLVTIRFIKNELFNQKTIHKIKEEYKKILGADIEINPISVDELLKDESGKFRVVQSMVSNKSS
jgi:phenylacetate-CoA ligase